MKTSRILYHLRRSIGYAKNVGLINLIKYYLECYCHVKGSNKEKTIMVMKYKKYGLKCYLRKNSADLLVFGNVCLANGYEFALKEFDKLDSVEYIVDLGANIGITSKILAMRYPGAKVVSVEPDADNFKVLKANMKSIEHSVVKKCGVWNKKTKLAILRGKEEYGFRLVEDSNGTIPVIGMAELIRENELTRIDILKVDIEGSEYQLFDESAEKWLDIVQSIVIEIHDHLVEGCYDRVHNTLIGKGFLEVKSPRDEESVFLYKKSKGE